MKIYTKTGDRGETGLYGGARVPKDSLSMQIIGHVDELNAALGVCLSLKPETRLLAILDRVQRDLFSLGADIATPPDAALTVERMNGDHVKQLEQWIDDIDSRVTPLQNFIVPGGVPLAAHLHLARAICRRAERSAARLTRDKKINADILPYLNRLSDLLFMMARHANSLENVAEHTWRGS